MALLGLLEAGPLLEQRLKALCPSAQDNIFCTEALAGVMEKSQVTPALHLVLHSYKPIEDNASDNRWREIYLVVAVQKNQRQGVGAKAVREAAPAMLKEAIAALDGWKCPGAVGVVRAIDPPNPQITQGFGYFPLAFTVDVVTDGATNPDF
ncbi:MAG: hypothetical protein HYU74_12635 [Dechloromonas sp.]|nr:hypothetical protein [Dechloromonas sp.]